MPSTRYVLTSLAILMVRDRDATEHGVGEKERRGMMRKPSVNERYIRTLKNSVRTPVRTVCVGLRDYADRIHGRKCHAIMGRSHYAARCCAALVRPKLHYLDLLQTCCRRCSRPKLVLLYTFVVHCIALRWTHIVVGLQQIRNKSTARSFSPKRLSCFHQRSAATRGACVNGT